MLRNLVILITSSTILLIVFNPEINPLLMSICTFVEDAIREVYNFFRIILDKIIRWLKSEKEKPTPVAALNGILSFAIAIIATIADYVIISLTINVILPIDNAGKALTIALVSMAALMGFLLHTMQNKYVRIVTIILAVSLTIMIGALAYARTAEILGAESFVSQEGTNAQEQENTDGSMIIDGKDETSSTETQDTGSEDVKFYKPLMLTIMTLIAVLVQASQIIGYYCAFSVAGSPLTWVFSSPILLVLGVPYGFSYLVFKIQLAKALTGIINGMLEIFGKAREWLRLYLIPSGRSEREFKREKVSLERASELDSLRTRNSIENAKHLFEINESRREHELISKAKGIVRDLVINCLTEVCNATEKLYKDLSQHIADNLIKASLDKVTTMFGPAVDQIIMEYVIPDIEQFLMSSDGKYYVRKLFDDQRKKDEVQNEEIYTKV